MGLFALLSAAKLSQFGLRLNIILFHAFGVQARAAVPTERPGTRSVFKGAERIDSRTVHTPSRRLGNPVRKRVQYDPDGPARDENQEIEMTLNRFGQ